MLKIKPLIRKYEFDAVDLIESGLKEYFSEYDSKYNPDLSNICDYYNNANNIFLIGMIGEEVVSTGGLIQENDDTGRIIRMSVKKEHRRKGYASEMLKALERHGQEKGYDQIVLETTKTWRRAIEFYRRNDYKTISFDEMDIHFKKIL